jgi:multiple sugar transport system substrate-binding protein
MKEPPRALTRQNGVSKYRSVDGRTSIVPRSSCPSRRALLSGAVTAIAVGGLPAAFPRRSRAQTPPVLRIAQWTHFVPGYDEWFDRKFAREWGERNGVTVEIDHLALSEMRARGDTEIATQQGHDLFAFPEPPAAYQAQVIPLTDVVTECERRFGHLPGFVQRGVLDPKTKQYFALPESWAPAPLHYRTDLWGEAGLKPDSWELLRDGARKIREKRGIPAGFGLAPEPDSNMTLRGLLWAFGAAEQDEAGQVAIYSPATIEAVKLMATIYRESMISDVFLWDAASNNRAFLWGQASIIQNAISAIRSMEKSNPELAKKATLALPAAGPKARLAPANVLHCYVLWRFSDKIELAKRFLVDLVAAADESLRASEFYNLPCFPRAVHELPKKLGVGKGSQPGKATPAVPADRYAVLAEADRWSAAPGHPGHFTPAIDETLQRGVIPLMFARVARGEQTAEVSVRAAEAEMRRIFARWQR